MHWTSQESSPGVKLSRRISAQTRFREGCKCPGNYVSALMWLPLAIAQSTPRDTFHLSLEHTLEGNQYVRRSRHRICQIFRRKLFGEMQ